MFTNKLELFPGPLSFVNLKIMKITFFDGINQIQNGMFYLAGVIN